MSASDTDGMPLVTGDVNDIHSSASSAYSYAEQAGGQSSAVATAMSSIPPIVAVGPAADQMRAFGGQLSAAMKAVAAAYDKVSTMLKQVARVTDEAQQAERAAEKAKTELSQAKATLTQAEQALAQAQQAVQDAHNPLSAGNNPLNPTPGPSAGQLAAVQAAQQQVTAAQHAVTEAARIYRVAEKRFTEAEQGRQKMLQRFSQLCVEEAIVATREIPQAPANFVDLAAVNQLRSEAASLLDLPLLTVSGFSTAHLGQVEAALGNLNSGSLDAWTNGTLARLFPKPKPQSHGPSGVLGFLEGGLHLGERFLGDVGKSSLSMVTGIPAAVYNLSKLSWEWTKWRLNPGGPHPPDLITAVLNNPGALIGLNTIEHDPVKGVADLVPTVASFFVGGGIETSASKYLETADKSFTAAQGELSMANRWDEMRAASGTWDPKLTAWANASRYQGRADLEAAQLAKNRSDLLSTVHGGLDHYDKVGSVAGTVNMANGAANGDSNDPFVEDYGLGKLLPVMVR